MNLEFLSQTVWTRRDEALGEVIAYPDTLVGTDSHTTMVNGLAVLGWGVGGIEAEAAMLGQPVSMLIPEVVGFKLTGKLREGVTATDLVLTVTQMLRKKGVVGKFVEFYGPGLNDMTVADRATIGNMAPNTAPPAVLPGGRQDDRVSAHHEPHGRARGPRRGLRPGEGMWRTAETPDPVVHRRARARSRRRAASLAGPKRPQDRVLWTTPSRTSSRHGEGVPQGVGARPARQGRGHQLRPQPRRRGDRGDHVLHQHVEPERDDRRGLLARNAVAKGLKTKPG